VYNEKRGSNIFHTFFATPVVHGICSPYVSNVPPHTIIHVLCVVEDNAISQGCNFLALYQIKSNLVFIEAELISI